MNMYIQILILIHIYFLIEGNVLGCDIEYMMSMYMTSDDMNIRPDTKRRERLDGSVWISLRSTIKRTCHYYFHLSARETESL